MTSQLDTEVVMKFTRHIDPLDIAVAAVVLAIAGALALAGLHALAGGAVLSLPVTLAVLRPTRRSCIGLR